MTTTIGQRLKEAREEQRLTLEKVFESTRIRVQYLQALEADDLSVMPSPVQARGYLRNYAEYLGMDVGKMLEDLRESNAQSPSEVVIGPADVPAVQDAQLQPEPATASVDVPVEKPTPLTKPKPARRKKAATPSADDSVTTPKRRGRKKAGLELEFQIEPPNITLNQSGEQIEGAGEGSPTQGDETLRSQQSASSHSPDDPRGRDNAGFETSSGSILETDFGNALQVPLDAPQSVEHQPRTHINDNLWQTWLNRLISILSARGKRPTLVPKKASVSEMEPTAGILRNELPEVPVQEINPLLESSSEIFKEIGRDLRERRELLSLHLEEVERNTHVKAHYLDALERGAMDDLPSTVQTRGMLSNYATFLDLDVDVLLLRFADALQARHRERNPQKPARKPGQPILANLPPMRSFIAGDLVFGVGIVVLLVGFAIWGVSRVLTLQSQQDVNPTAPSISDILLAPQDPLSFTATPTVAPVGSFPGEATVTVVIPTLNVNVNVQVNLVAVERTYMRVIVDGETAFEGRVVPGTAYPFEAVDQVEVLVGSGAAIRIVYNGRDLGLLGSFGQVVSNIYRASEIITPTGMPTATATLTPTPTNTVPPTATSQFTSTPAPANTVVP
jgi:cytoskeleton protein RodZ